MTTELKLRPNLPPALVTRVYESVGAASVAWKVGDEGERIFDTEFALKVADELVEHIEHAFDNREDRLFPHLRSLAFHLGYWEHDSTTGHTAQAKQVLDTILRMLEQPR